MKATLAARGAVAGYGGRDALAGVDLNVFSGEIVALLGPNGAGKSTLVRVLSGAMPLRAGEVELGGAPF
ncbi:MAG TPA: ATP-binding cassette domain-containing protein, partial [Minicystis sp.]|nr:ATP-binding cassette domain-containing protein [Minicystis sp.]